MDKYTCIIIEDEPLALEKTKDFVIKVPFLHLSATFDNALSGLAYLNNNKLDLLDRLSSQSAIETNEPNGYYDSIFNYFNESKQLIKTETHGTTSIGINYVESIVTYDYDKNGSMIRTCISSGNTKTMCKYIIFKYENGGKVESSSDSFSLDIDRLDEPHTDPIQKYNYYPNGLLKSIGDKYFVYENNKNLSEEYSLSGRNKTEIIYYSYDQNGNCVKKENIRPIESSYDEKTGITEVNSYDTSIILMNYDNENLITDFQYKNSLRDRDYKLNKYNYTFY